jgi:hypothetical protein
MSYMIEQESFGSEESVIETHAQIKARQVSKIKEIADALFTCGLCAIDRQATALGLPRSTAWSVRRANHKNSGLSAATIQRILRAPQLPPLAVWSRDEVTRIDDEGCGVFRPGTADGLERCFPS